MKTGGSHGQGQYDIGGSPAVGTGSGGGAVDAGA
jgi:hypothetical protein